MYTVNLCLFETIDKFLLFSFAFDLSVLIAGVEKINLTSGRNLRIKSRNFFSYLNIFSAVGKEASLVPIYSINDRLVSLAMELSNALYWQSSLLESNKLLRIFNETFYVP